MAISTLSITDLPELLAGLPPADQAVFDRLFLVDATVGQLVAPEAMTAWIEKFFGSVGAVMRQKIVKVTNLITMEGALFNELRASRPMEAKTGEELRQAIACGAGGPFSHPETGTPADLFGRIAGDRCVTASNVAKYDGFHGLVIFAEQDPLAITREGVRDYLATARRWAEAALAVDPQAIYYFLLWNCLWKSGASIVHGHAQMTMTRGMHYARIEGLRRAAGSYRELHGRNYFDDLFLIHERLGLAWNKPGVRGLAYLTPIKEKEIMLLAAREDERLYDEVHRILARYAELGVKSFNAALIQPPLSPAPENWEGFPVIVRLVDRGDPANKTADFGGMELYAQSVVSSDPFRVAKKMRE